MSTLTSNLKKLLPKPIVYFYRTVFAGNNPPLYNFPEFQTKEDLVLNNGRLYELFLNHDGRKAIKWTHYIEIYEELLDPFRLKTLDKSQNQTDQIRLLEIGVFNGGSLEIWKSYFGSNSTIFGIDINPKCASLNIPGVQIRIGSQVDQQFLLEVIRELGKPNIIIDDGSHHSDHVSKTLEYLWPYLDEGGIYIIEDTHASYWKEYGGGLGKRQSIIEFTKDVVDTLHHHYLRKNMPKRTAFLKNSVSSITFHDSIIVLKKKKSVPPKLLSIGSISSVKNEDEERLYFD